MTLFVQIAIECTLLSLALVLPGWRSAWWSSLLGGWLEARTFQVPPARAPPPPPFRGGRRYSIALCIAGEPRTFNLPCAHMLLLERLIKPLQQSGYELQVFVELKEIKAGDIIRADFEKVHRVFESQGFHAEWDYFLASSPEAPPQCILETHGFIQTHIEQTFGQLNTMERCLGKIEAAEARLKRSFDIVMRTRPDMLWYGTFDAHAYDLRSIATFQDYSPPLAQRVERPSDHVISVPRALADALLGQARYYNCSQKHLTVPDRDMEALLWNAIGHVASRYDLVRRRIYMPAIVFAEVSTHPKRGCIFFWQSSANQSKWMSQCMAALSQCYAGKIPEPISPP